jgi:Glycosyl transferases group 1
LSDRDLRHHLHVAARRTVRQIQTARQRRVMMPPALRVASHPGPPTVYYLCPHSDQPSGGIRAIYRHVDILNAAGIGATVVHAPDGFACTWFEHNTRVSGARAVTLSEQDVLVVPEWYGPGLTTLSAGPRLIVFNQNAYKTFAGLDPGSPPGAPYRDLPGLEAVLVVSRDNAEYLRFAFPELSVTQVRNAIDTALFHPAPPGQDARRRLAVMPRKRPDDVHQVLRLLAAHGSLDGWEVVTIEDRSEAQTAELLRSCAIFLSFSAYEGFGLPPAEAMACGCYVVGFPGLGGREYFDPSFSSPVEEGDVLAFAKAAAAALAADPVSRTERARAASRHILASYGLQGQRDDLLGFFVPLLKE